jgi:hypothetical protein
MALKLEAVITVIIKTRLNMKKHCKHISSLFVTLILFFILPVAAHAFPSGISGATHKSGNTGCNCHGGNAFNPDVSVVIDGPDTLVVNQVASYTVTVSGGPYTESGVDIAASNNNLSPVSTYLYLLDNELTHSNPVPYVGGQVVYEFTYTAPDTALPQTLYATGSSRKNWNWAVDKQLVIIPDVPVELVSFNANVLDNQVNLSWTTSTETNNRGFEIERSSDGSYYMVRGFVGGKGTTSQPHNYNFTDNDAKGNLFYRLKQIDFNGKYHYSNVIEVNSTSSPAYGLEQNYPNPFNPTTLIQYTLPNEGIVTLTIYDVLGREVRILINGYQEAGNHSIYFDASGLESGIYFYRLEAGHNFTSVRKMVLLH